MSLHAGATMEIAGFRGRLDLNGSAVKLVTWLPCMRWAALVIHTNPPESITVKPENLVAIGSQDCAVYESLRRRRNNWEHEFQRHVEQRYAEQKRIDDKERRQRRADLQRSDEEERRRDEETRRQERIHQVREVAARAKSTNRTTDLTHDALVVVCQFLNLSQLDPLRFVCKAWSAAARAAARDPTWQLTMLSANELKRYSNALPVSLAMRQRWVHVNLRKARHTHTAQEAKAAGLTMGQMIAAGYSPRACFDAGF